MLGDHMSAKISVKPVKHGSSPEIFKGCCKQFLACLQVIKKWASTFFQCLFCCRGSASKPLPPTKIQTPTVPEDVRKGEVSTEEPKYDVQKAKERYDATLKELMAIFVSIRNVGKEPLANEIREYVAALKDYMASKDEDQVACYECFEN